MATATILNHAKKKKACCLFSVVFFIAPDSSFHPSFDSFYFYFPDTFSLSISLPKHVPASFKHPALLFHLCLGLYIFFIFVTYPVQITLAVNFPTFPYNRDVNFAVTKVAQCRCETHDSFKL